MVCAMPSCVMGVYGTKAAMRLPLGVTCTRHVGWECGRERCESDAATYEDVAPARAAGYANAHVMDAHRASYGRHEEARRDAWRAQQCTERCVGEDRAPLARAPTCM
jgi:hypothetical protein